MNHLNQQASLFRKQIKWKVLEDFSGALLVTAHIEGRRAASYAIYKNDWKHCANRKGLMVSIIKHLEYQVLAEALRQVAVSA